MRSNEVTDTAAVARDGLASRFDTLVLDAFGTLCHWPERTIPSAAHVIWARSPLRDTVPVTTVIDWVYGLDGSELAPGRLTEAEFEDDQQRRWLAAIERLDTPDPSWTVRLCERATARRMPEPFPDVAPFLRAIGDSGLAWVICSNAAPDIVPKLLDRLGGEVPAPAGIVISSRVGALKPHERMYLALAEVADPARSLFIGDRLEPDVFGPLRHGYRVAHLRRGSDVPGVLPGQSLGERYLGSFSTLLDLAPDAVPAGRSAAKEP